MIGFTEKLPCAGEKNTQISVIYFPWLSTSPARKALEVEAFCYFGASRREKSAGGEPKNWFGLFESDLGFAVPASMSCLKNDCLSRTFLPFFVVPGLKRSYVHDR